MVRCGAKSPLVADRRPSLALMAAHGTTMEDMYDGDVLLTMLNMRSDSLNWMRDCIGSQWSSRSAGVMWSRGPRLLTSRAAVYSTAVNGFRVVDGRSARTELQ